VGEKCDEGVEAGVESVADEVQRGRYAGPDHLHGRDAQFRCACFG
jgi:hypothetical protein